MMIEIESGVKVKTVSFPGELKVTMLSCAEGGVTGLLTGESPEQAEIKSKMKTKESMMM